MNFKDNEKNINISMPTTNLKEKSFKANQEKDAVQKKE
jgi:hypothetical protein